MLKLNLVYACALTGAFALSFVLTVYFRRLALRWKIYDHPCGRKAHREPVPLLGGVAIVGAFYGMLFLYLAVAFGFEELGAEGLAAKLFATLGTHYQSKLAGILAGGLMVFVLGLIDDFRPLGPVPKLAGQTAAALVLVGSEVRLDLFVLTDHPAWACAATVVWIVFMTNAMNFLDNMDGLCGGVAVVAAFSFYLSAQPYEAGLVHLLVLIFSGSVAGFLWHNLAPARIFMGDAGSLFAGYMLATVAVIGTFHLPGTPSRLSLAAPVLALSVPLFDTLSVLFIRWKNGQNIMVGDARHFSHRLVELGMTPRQAVGFIVLVAAIVGLGGALLHQTDPSGTLIILAQTAGLFFLIVLLMAVHTRRGE